MPQTVHFGMKWAEWSKLGTVQNMLVLLLSKDNCSRWLKEAETNSEFNGLGTRGCQSSLDTAADYTRCQHSPAQNQPHEKVHLTKSYNDTYAFIGLFKV